MAYGGSQARGRIGAVTTSLPHSHSNTGSESRLQPTPQLMAMPDFNPLSKARDRTHNLVVPSRIHFRSAMTGTPPSWALLISGWRIQRCYGKSALASSALRYGAPARK